MKMLMKTGTARIKIAINIETGTTPENTQETIHTVETGHRSVMVQIDPTVKTYTEMIVMTRPVGLKRKITCVMMRMI